MIDLEYILIYLVRVITFLLFVHFNFQDVVWANGLKLCISDKIFVKFQRNANIYRARYGKIGRYFLLE